MADFTLLENDWLLTWMARTVVYHRMLWAELADTGIRKKCNAKFWKENNINPSSIQDQCFACQFKTIIDNQEGQRSRCKDGCIFEWPGGSCQEDLNGLYDLWENSETIEARKKYAALIRDLPLKPEFAKELGE